jgi:hypothetical protein
VYIARFPGFDPKPVTAVMAPAAAPVEPGGSESDEDDDGDDALHAASEAARAKTTSEEDLAEVVSMSGR